MPNRLAACCMLHQDRAALIARVMSAARACLEGFGLATAEDNDPDSGCLLAFEDEFLAFED